MFRRKNGVTVIAEGLKIEGNVSADGGVELHGLVEGELHCKSLRISKKGRIVGKVDAEVIVIDGTVEGPVHGTHVTLEPNAHVTGDVHHESFAVEKGAFFDGRSRQREKSGKAAREPAKKFAATKLGAATDTKPSDAKAKDEVRAAAATDKAPASDKAPAAA